MRNGKTFCPIYVGRMACQIMLMVEVNLTKLPLLTTLGKTRKEPKSESKTLPPDPLIVVFILMVMSRWPIVIYILIFGVPCLILLVYFLSGGGT